ncbi:hypothetical protein [Desulfovibrio gilichinskyi]|uniref:hypothetical protein n=1 Tax=Desulfovibrio gilichinskyi TaxID=1519643 RepID=UPI001BAFFE69|nr:hypothetical protein [Desulfovibrio gilichinskyi]
MFVTICCIVAVVHLGYSFLIAYFGKRFSLKDFEHRVNKVTDGLFVAMGGGILLSNRA